MVHFLYFPLPLHIISGYSCSISNLHLCLFLELALDNMVLLCLHLREYMWFCLYGSFDRDCVKLLAGY